MKQQLRELYDIAFVSAGKENQFETTHLDVAEKFAELIILECASIIDNDSTLEGIVGVDLKEHFGIQ